MAKVTYEFDSLIQEDAIEMKMVHLSNKFYSALCEIENAARDLRKIGEFSDRENDLLAIILEQSNIIWEIE